MAHATCLAAARSWLLKKQGWDVERQGIGATVIGAGVGREAVRTIAARFGLPYAPFSALLPDTDAAWTSSCAPAVAVALLAADA
jgi:uncharacterized protein YidB (DUF937 family)